MDGLQLFLFATGWTINRLYLSRGEVDLKKDDDNGQSAASARVVLIEQRTQRDEGGRGIAQIIPDRDLELPHQSHMEAAAKALLASEHVIIMTGFPCLLQNNPPTETDGPLGAICIARCLVALGKKVRLITDECNEEVLIACAAASGVCTMGKDAEGTPLLQLESFPGMPSFGPTDLKRLEEIKRGVDCIVAVERAGPSQDGLYRTMTGKDMTAILAPLDTLLLPEGSDEVLLDTQLTTERTEVDSADTEATAEAAARVVSIGIGDGGNEVGMGKVFEKVINSDIPNAKEIACVVPCDHLLVSSVSNWGAYGLAASTALLSTIQQSSLCYGFSVRGALEKCLPSEEQERSICTAAVNAGAGDGISGQRELYVDGMPLEESLHVLHCVKDIASGI